MNKKVVPVEFVAMRSTLWRDLPSRAKRGITLQLSAFA